MPESFRGLRVAAFESRMADSTAVLLSRHGGVPVEAPSLREIPLDDQTEAIEFGRALVAGSFDVVVLLTGVGTRFLVQAIESQIPRDSWKKAFEQTFSIARGPKPVAALREFDCKVDLVVPEPNTWRELIEAFRSTNPAPGVRVAVQEYGESNAELIAGLEALGAIVTRVRVYRWALPDDTRPLREALRAIVAGEIGAAMFTSMKQVDHVFEIAREEAIAEALTKALNTQVVICSIGPSTSLALRNAGIGVDIEPAHPKLGRLIAESAERWDSVGKRIPATAFGTPKSVHAGVVSAIGSRDETVANEESSLNDSIFMKACRRERTDTTPVWLMRQAGRYMAEYRELRSKVGFLDLCKTPELAAEVTISAAVRLGVDAAILFADILLILEPLGFDLEFSRGEGPVIHNPLRESKDVDRVKAVEDLAPVSFVFDAVRLIRAGLPRGLPLIGFAGAPFTLACYAIEGGGSRHYDRAKAFMYRDPGAWNALMERLVDATALYLNAQVAAGAQALQVFDSWVGTLCGSDYIEFVQPHMKRLFTRIDPNVPVIHFGADTGSLLELQRDAGGDVIGLDWRVDLDRSWERLGSSVAVQGNLDPVVLLGPIERVRSEARRILDQARGRAGHIFNLGHGILPSTPVDHVIELVEIVHAYRSGVRDQGSECP
jgi:uroporphyrinogen decarboxylase